MAPKQRERRTQARWVYAYELDPPQPEPRFRTIRAVLRRARMAAQRGGHLWTGRIVAETNITHILVVTDNPGQGRLVDRAIEAELQHLDMNFALTGPARFSLLSARPGRDAVPNEPGRSRGRPRARGT